MKKTRTILAGIAAAALFVISGCGAVPENTVNSVADLAGKKIGTQLGTTGYVLAQEEIENAKVEGYNKGADAVQALRRGKVDAVIIDIETARALTADSTDLRIIEEPFIKEDYSIAYRIGNDELGARLNKALDELEADGTLRSIVFHWIGDTADHASYTPQDNVIKEGSLVMATNAEFPPYESMENGQIVGIDVDMMRAVCDKIGMTLEIENMSFESIIPAVTSGKADVGVAGMSINEERLESVNFTKKYATSTQAIIVRA